VKRSLKVCRIALAEWLLVMTFLFPWTAMAQNDEIDDAAENALKSHELASSDMMYQQEEFKAMYYQNIQIIQLLKEILDSLQRLNEREAKVVKNAQGG
jgi:hypothetical protein